jgi:hypothetical protein
LIGHDCDLPAFGRTSLKNMWNVALKDPIVIIDCPAFSTLARNERPIQIKERDPQWHAGAV